jgi:hypothetical protein
MFWFRAVLDGDLMSGQQQHLILNQEVWFELGVEASAECDALFATPVERLLGKREREHECPVVLRGQA